MRGFLIYASRKISSYETVCDGKNIVVLCDQEKLGDGWGYVSESGDEKRDGSENIKPSMLMLLKYTSVLLEKRGDM